jgi:hypothetical protein
MITAAVWLLLALWVTAVVAAVAVWPWLRRCSDLHIPSASYAPFLFSFYAGGHKEMSAVLADQ